jgi:hypothetical protein
MPMHPSFQIFQFEVADFLPSKKRASPMDAAPTRIEMLEKICIPLKLPAVFNIAPMIGRPVRDL